MTGAKRLDYETISEYEERLYRNRTLYDLSWQEVTDLLELEQHADTTRKESYGYIKRANQEKSISKKDKNFMVINDVHLPFEREDTLEVISNHAPEIDYLVIAGDLLDCHSISFFPKIEGWTLEDELVYAHKWLHKVRQILDEGQEIILINGNHEERWMTEIKKMHQKNMQKFINPNLLEMLIDGFTIYDEDGKRKRYPGVDGVRFIPHWFVNIDNKLIIAHPKNFSQVDGKMCEKTTEHFINRGEEFDVVLFGHTHKYSQMTVSRRQGKYAVENGCMCKPAGYSDRGKLNFTPQHYCYTLISYDDDKPIDFNDVRVIHLDANGKEQESSLNL